MSERGWPGFTDGIDELRQKAIKKAAAARHRRRHGSRTPPGLLRPQAGSFRQAKPRPIAPDHGLRLGHRRRERYLPRLAASLCLLQRPRHRGKPSRQDRDRPVRPDRARARDRPARRTTPLPHTAAATALCLSALGALGYAITIVAGLAA